MTACEHDNGVEQVEDVEVCEMCGETVEPDPWLAGLTFETPTVNRSKFARRARTGRMR